MRLILEIYDIQTRIWETWPDKIVCVKRLSDEVLRCELTMVVATAAHTKQPQNQIHISSSSSPRSTSLKSSSSFSPSSVSSISSLSPTRNFSFLLVLALLTINKSFQIGDPFLMIRRL